MERTSQKEILRQLGRLDRALLADDISDELRSDLLSVRQLLKDLAGLTVQPAEAARLLGVSHPALKKWLDSGEIATVMTREGRREIPVEELLSLLDGIEDLRLQRTQRPLTHLMRDRRREAEEAVDVSQLLPRRHLRGHRTAELHSLAYHRLVAEKLTKHRVELARQTLERWSEEGRIDPRWERRWRTLLARPIPEIQKRISADSAQARELRQSSPFAGVLTTQERKTLFDAVEARAGG